MANQYKNKVVYNGATLIDLSDTTAVQSDVASGKYFYLATGEKVEGTASDGGSETTRTTIVPEQTANYTERYNQINYVAPLVVGEVYIYTIDGVETQSMAFDNYGTVAIGSPETSIGFEYGNGVMYLSIADSSLRTTHTVKVEQESSGGGGGDSSVSLQTKSVSYTPTASQQTASITADSGYDGLSEVDITVNAIPSQYIVPTGNKAITENGTGIDVAQYATVSVAVPTSGGSSMNIQTSQSTTRRNNTALGSITSLTCSTGGTYEVYWACARSSTSQTWGSQLYINGTAYGTENTTWSNHVQNNHLTGVTIPANATVAIYGRSRSGYYIYVPQLTIIQTA